MNRSAISTILQELNIPEDSVANIYNYGSWVYRTNSPTSDRDIMIVTRTTQKPLVFDDDFDYFHNFELHKFWNQYDVCVHSVENFEKLLEKNYLLAVECIFLPNEFKIKEEIDFQPIYLEKYYNILRLKQVAFYENDTAIKMFDVENNSTYPVRSSRSSEDNQSKNDYLFKNLFHGFRYLDFAEQLIQTKSIHNFKRVTRIFNQMKKIRGDPSSDSGLQRVAEFIRERSAGYKPKFDALMPVNIVRGTFEVNITIDCTRHTEDLIDQLKKVCRNTKYKIIFIEWVAYKGRQNFRELMVLSHYDGEYPSIVKQIEDEVYQHFKDFNIIRIKIKSSVSNEGVPQSDLEKRLFWNGRTNYFQLQYKIPLNEDSDNAEASEGNKLANFYDLYRSSHKSRSGGRLSHKAFIKKSEKNLQHTLTMCLFNVGRGNAFEKSDTIVNFLTTKDFPPLKATIEFIVHDTNTDLDNIWDY